MKNSNSNKVNFGQDTNCTLHSGKFEEGNPSLDVSRETSDCARLGQAGRRLKGGSNDGVAARGSETAAAAGGGS